MADRAQAARAAESIVQLEPSFDDAFQRLRKGRSYSADVATGVVRGSHEMGGRTFAYSLDVPPAYKPSVRYQVRFQLHGGVGRPEAALRGSGAIGALAGAEQIYVCRRGGTRHGGALRKSRTFAIILDKVKRTYNVDENRVAVSGVSDGGTGAYYIAMRDTTPFASFLPLNGFIMVLENAIARRSDERAVPEQPAQQAAVRRQRRPRSAVSDEHRRPLVAHLQKAAWRSRICRSPNGGHDTSWWPDVKESFERFVHDHPRDPLPDGADVGIGIRPQAASIGSGSIDSARAGSRSRCRT